MGNEYYLGLVLNADSVGWAVTNPKYELKKVHGKTLWGVRLFEPAQTAEETRTLRVNRRRIDRRKQRIDLLQGIFSEEINKIDDGFFLRLKESRYTPEDKRDKDGNCPELPYTLFVDPDYTDKHYHKQFPTVYHLRKWLMETDEIPDIRLVYLAFHHMVKNRGHFLFPGEINIRQIKDEQETLKLLFQDFMDEGLHFSLAIDHESLVTIKRILQDISLGINEKKKALIKATGAATSCEKALLNLLAGGTVKLSELLEDRSLDDTEKPKISFSQNTYEDTVPDYKAALGETFELIEKAKAVYDWVLLSNILGEHNTLSEAKIQLYNKHREDLAYIKNLVKTELGTDANRDIFVYSKKELANYPAYIGMTRVNGRKTVLEGKRCSKEEFYDFLKKQVLQKISDENKTAYLKQEIEKGTLLPLQVTRDNSVIPNQLHAYEMKRIIDNLGERIPLLKEKSDYLLQILTFCIPYYVGPLNGVVKGKNRTNWAVRNSNEKVYPWNFDQVINLEASAEVFIRRMTGKCTYLPQEDVIPKYSLLYAKYEVLNELNTLRINGEAISVSLKQELYENVFKEKRKVTQKVLADYLRKTGHLEKNEPVIFSGIDDAFKNSLKAYHDLKHKLTDTFLTEEEQEDIILNITLFGDDKNLLKKRLTHKYPELEEHELNALASISYKGWGRLSKKFLTGVTAPCPETGEKWSIIQVMWETNDNLMQVLSDKYLFRKFIDNINHAGEPQELSYELLEDSYLSAPVKRQVWQAILLVKELQEILGEAPKRVFVETVLESKDYKTESRQKKLIAAYKKVKDKNRDWVAELQDINDYQLRSTKLYLYYTQKGRCMYTEEEIPLQELFDNTKYDIDHIYPESITMDNTLNNCVLVKRAVNQKKSDSYPLPKEIQQKRNRFWETLLDEHLIDKEKYNRLIRSEKLTEEELAGFIERSVTEKHHSVKAVVQILKQALPDTEVACVKADNLHRFRYDFSLIRVPELNDYYHAKDAYLNIVVGNGFHVKFTKNPIWYIKESPRRSYNLKKMFTSGKDIVRNDEVAWKAGEQGTIATVRKVMNKNNIMVTRRSYKVKGGLFDQLPLKKGKGQIPLKASDPRLSGEEGISKYGGYNKAAGTYYMLVSSIDKKGNEMRTIEYVPMHLESRLEASSKEMQNYLKTTLGLHQPKILIPVIKKDTLFKIDGFYMWLTGRSTSSLIFKNANQLLLPEKEMEILKKVLKYVFRQRDNKALLLVEEDHLTDADLVHVYEVFISKLENTVYSVRLGNQIKTLQQGYETFLRLSSEEKCIVLNEILHLYQCQSQAANLQLIGGPKNAGIITMKKNISDLNQISIINQSPTGFYETEIDLLKV